MQNLDQKVNQQQNPICLEQQLHASPQNSTPKLLVMLETFRRSGHTVNFSQTLAVSFLGHFKEMSRTTMTS